MHAQDGRLDLREVSVQSVGSLTRLLSSCMNGTNLEFYDLDLIGL